MNEKNLVQKLNELDALQEEQKRLPSGARVPRFTGMTPQERVHDHIVSKKLNEKERLMAQLKEVCSSNNNKKRCSAVRLVWLAGCPCKGKEERGLLSWTTYGDYTHRPNTFCFRSYINRLSRRTRFSRPSSAPRERKPSALPMWSRRSLQPMSRLSMSSRESLCRSREGNRVQHHCCFKCRAFLSCPSSKLRVLAPLRIFLIILSSSFCLCSCFPFRF